MAVIALVVGFGCGIVFTLFFTEDWRDKDSKDDDEQDKPEVKNE